MDPSANDFDYYEETPSVKGPYGPTYKGICGVHVTDVPAGGTFTCYDKDESMLCNCQALVMGGRYRCCSKVEGCSSADDFDYYEETPLAKAPYEPTYKGICGVHVTDVPAGGTFTCYDKNKSMLCNCQVLVFAGRYRCCSKVGGCTSANDFDYYQGTPSVKGVSTPIKDVGICGVQVLDVDLGPGGWFYCTDKIYGLEYDCLHIVVGSSYYCYGNDDKPYPYTKWESCETGCVLTWPR